MEAKPAGRSLWHELTFDSEASRSETSELSSSEGRSISTELEGAEGESSRHHRANSASQWSDYSSSESEFLFTDRRTPANQASAEHEEEDGEHARVMQERHDRGECKPCMFFLRRGGCISGAMCSYCHICSEARQTSTCPETHKTRCGALQRDRYNRMADQVVAKLEVTPGEEHNKFAEAIRKSGHEFLKAAMRRRFGGFAEQQVSNAGGPARASTKCSL